ncbi:hypothetical protein NC653_037418 [Populus alba x Populus x berolinensis]|uniref:Uncharacterized protein n=1 Tax=Populus alba x Populus x berolinensis TaxID=444605 RepID=A0AAD6LEB8_9ROSI|nr:hypothetical protein NC653_037418 [Populus alba x Populus x berolinensis]
MALYDSVTCGKACKKKDLADEDSESKQRREWNDLVLNEGTELLKANYGDLVLFVDGLKTIEGRMASGAVILFIKCVASGSEEKERSNGVHAICAAKSAAQPYISLATISSL